MDDKTIVHRISELVDREHVIRADVQAGRISTNDEREQLTELEVQLDQLWDLLRRRRAARANGTDPDAVPERPATEVEGYLQ